MKTRPTGNTSNADWMGSLCPALTSMPLKHLAVPVLFLGVVDGYYVVAKMFEWFYHINNGSFSLWHLCLISQVLVFYHHPSAESCPVMWPGCKIPAPWANTTDASKLIQFLETTLGERAKYGSFHVSQAILTPRVKTIARGLVRGLRNYLVEKNLPTIMMWVEAQKPGVDGVNIITSDFVELVDFANTVIKLNNLLIQDRPGT
ncbi:PI-PLC X domain-containing protein 3-like [Sinocyclocheilus grahami]|uniref:PI-PLC X domain-containing protein 3-like n=1 Tax=Sinocyclocheilus grahami TaxID=75366 RepID=UPI0007AD0BDC|nr:PREDICTED: PI-PLC X domain-containing protein 3-like [Sinocyclocheilus grahami]